METQLPNELILPNLSQEMRHFLETLQESDNSERARWARLMLKIRCMTIFDVTKAFEFGFCPQSI